MKAYLVCLMLVVLLALFAYWADSSACANTAQQTGLETKYSYKSGCYMKTPEGWRPVP